MITCKVYLSRYFFCFIPLHLIYAEINGSLLHFSTDVCVCVCVHMRQVRKREIQFCLWNVKKRNQCLWNVSYERKLLKDHSTFQLFLTKCSFFFFWKCVTFFFSFSFGSIKPSWDEEDCDYSLSHLNSLFEKSLWISHFFSSSFQVSLGQFTNSDLFSPRKFATIRKKDQTPKSSIGNKGFCFPCWLEQVVVRGLTSYFCLSAFVAWPSMITSYWIAARDHGYSQLY